MNWWEEDDDVEVAPPRVLVPHTGEEKLYGERYPRIHARPVVAAPPELSRRKRRRWERNERARLRAEEREQRNAAVGSWRADRPEPARAGLGVVLVLIAVLFAAFVVWHARSTSPAIPAAAPAPVATAPATRADPTIAAPSTSSLGQHQGGDVAAPDLVPNYLPGPAGGTAYRFLLAYDSYNPVDPAGQRTWADSWAPYAAPTLTSSAATLGAVVWQQATRDRVDVIAQTVSGCAVVADSTQEITWECDVVRALFPIGGDASSPYRTETAHLRVVVGGKDTATPLVTTVALLSVDPAVAGHPG